MAFVVIMTLLPWTAGYGGNTPTVLADQPLSGSYVPDEILIGLEPDATGLLSSDGFTTGQFGIAALDQINQQFSVVQIETMFEEYDPSDTLIQQEGLDRVFLGFLWAPMCLA